MKDKIDYNKIDKNIRYYIRRINKLNFVKTKSSCQGHFTKNFKNSPIYYTEVRNGDAVGRFVKTQIHNPYILLRFDHKYDRDTLYRLFISNRRRIYNIYARPKIRLYAITPKNEKNVEYIPDYSMIVSKISKQYISICFFIGESYQEFRFETKIVFNKAIKRFRKKLFMIVISMLEFIEKLRK